MIGRALEARIFLRSFLLQAGFSDERRQGLGFAWAIDPALTRAHAGDAAGLSAARSRHLASFNCQPYAAGLPLGAAAALEARAGAGAHSVAARAASLKSSLGACLSGAADGFFWGALRPLAGALSLFVAAAGWRLGLRSSLLAGCVLGLLAFNAPALAARWVGLDRGLRDPDAAALAAARLPAQRWTATTRRAAAVLVLAAAWSWLGLPFTAPPLLAAAAFAAGAALTGRLRGPLRLAGAAGLLGTAAAIAGWTP